MQVSTPSLYPRRLPCTAMHVALEEMTLHMAVPCDKLAAVLPPQHLHRLLLTLVLRGTALHPSSYWAFGALPCSPPACGCTTWLLCFCLSAATYLAVSPTDWPGALQQEWKSRVQMLCA